MIDFIRQHPNYFQNLGIFLLNMLAVVISLPRWRRDWISKPKVRRWYGASFGLIGGFWVYFVWALIVHWPRS